MLIAGTSLSCKKVLMDENPANNARENFEILWQTVNDKYTFFELKNINWDSVYHHYDTQVYNGMSEQELFTVLDSMLFDLRDGHVNLTAPFNMSRNWQWYLNYPDNFSYELLERKYLTNAHKIAGGLQYTIIDSVGYIYHASFSRGFTLENLDAVMTYMKGTKGLIVDVRNNGGGYLNNAFALAQRLVTEEKLAMVTFEKAGAEKDNMGNGLGYSLGPSDGVNYKGEVAILTNRRCYSATNTFAALLFPFDNITQIGDQTGGGGGIPIDNELPNGWQYRFSATISLLAVDDTTFYNMESGIPPQILEQTTPANIANGKDPILERALSRFQ